LIIDNSFGLIKECDI